MIDAAVAAIRAGEAVVLPTDTVYGLCVMPFEQEPARLLYGLKGRSLDQPTAVLFADVAELLECVPELRGRPARIAGVLLPGPYTLIFPNPARVYPWVTGSRPDSIGVRVPMPGGPATAVLEQVRALAATSANLAGAPEPRRLDDVPQALRAGCGAVVDGGELPGVPSTVLDFTGPRPLVVREGAASPGEAIARVEAAVGRNRE